MSKPKTGTLAFGIPGSRRRPLADITKNIRFRVSDKNVKDGLGKNACECPGALGFRLTGKLKNKKCRYVEFHRAVIYMDFGDKRYTYRGRPSSSLRTEIIAQDRHGIFSAGEYEIQPLSVTERKKRGGAHSYRPKGHKRLYKTRRGTPIKIKHIRDLALGSEALARI